MVLSINSDGLGYPISQKRPRLAEQLEIVQDGESSVEEKREALRALEDTLGVMRRVLGPQHPDTQRAQENLEAYREEFPTTA